MYIDLMLRFQCLYETESSQKDHTKITWHSQTTFRHKSYIESELEKIIQYLLKIPNINFE